MTMNHWLERTGYVAVLVIGSAAAGQCPIDDLFFDYTINVDFGSSPFAVVTGDVNGDGHDDIVWTSFNSDDVMLTPGQGSAQFGMPVVIDSGAGPRAMHLADLDENGWLDLVVVWRNEDAVGVQLGLGDGAFGDSVRYTVGDAPSDVVVVDINGDSVLDLITGNWDSDDVSVLLGTGAGQYEEATNFPAGEQPGRLDAADIDGNGTIDLAAVHFSGEDFSILLGDGTGGFAPPLTQGGMAWLSDIALADLNLDGAVDLLVTQYAMGPPLMVLMGAGDGTFGSETTYLNEFVDGARRLMTADLDGDGDTDVVVSVSGDTNQLVVLTGAGDGSLGAPRAYDVGTTPNGIAIIDLNGDAHLDLLAACRGDSLFSMLIGIGDCAYRTQMHPRAGEFPTDVKIADLNGDGINDLVTVSWDSEVSVFRGTGAGHFAPTDIYPVNDGGYNIELADLNGDGILDIVVDKLLDHKPGLLIGVGDGTFEYGPAIDAGAQAESLVPLDLNHDGDQDLVLISRAKEQMEWYLGHGDGTFELGGVYPVGTTWSADILPADLDQDGWTDLAITRHYHDDVLILRGLAGGSFESLGSYAVGTGPKDLDVGDVNGDGVPDLVVGHWHTGDDEPVHLLLGLGDGTFVAGASIAAGVRPVAVALHDLDGDDVLDLIAADHSMSPLDDLLHVFHGHGDGTFATAVRFEIDDEPTAIAIGDLDGNGSPDVAVTAFNYKYLGYVSVLFNQCDFCPVDLDGDGHVGIGDLEAVITTWGPCPSCPADVDGDGLVGFSDLLAVLAAWGPCS